MSIACNFKGSQFIRHSFADQNSKSKDDKLTFSCCWLFLWTFWSWTLKLSCRYMGHFYSEDKTLLHLKVRRSSGLCLILWICLTSCALTFFSMSFVTTIMRVSQKNWKRCVFLNLILVRKTNKKNFFFCKKFVKLSYATLTFTEVRFKPETEIN